MANNVNVVNRGFEYLCAILAGSISSYSVPTYIGWGTANGSNATSTVLPATGPGGVQGAGQWMDVGPYSESSEARVQSSAVTVSSNVSASGTIAANYNATLTSGSGQSIGESFLVFTATKPAVFHIVTGNVQVSDTSLTVNTTGGANNAYWQMNNEVIKTTGVASAVWTIARAQNGSTAAIAHQNDNLTFGNIPGAGNNNPSNGDMFAHAGFQALALNSGDSIAFTWQINVTS